MATAKKQQPKRRNQPASSAAGFLGIHQVRYLNLRRVLAENFNGVQLELARAIARDEGYLSRLLSDPVALSHQHIGDRAARHIETRLKREPFWLDQNHDLLTLQVKGSPAVNLIGQNACPLCSVISSQGTEQNMQDAGLFVRSPPTPGRCYAVRVADHTGRIRAGEFVCCDPDRDPVQGDQVLIRFANGQSFLRDFVNQSPERIVLESLTTPGKFEVLERSSVTRMHTVAAILPASSMYPRIDQSTIERERVAS